MSSKEIKVPGYPRQKKTGESVPMAISVNENTPQDLREYQAWRKQNGLHKVGNGILMSTALYQTDAMYREIVDRNRKKGIRPHAKRYIDNFKTGA